MYLIYNSNSHLYVHMQHTSVLMNISTKLYKCTSTLHSWNRLLCDLFQVKRVYLPKSGPTVTSSAARQGTSFTT